MRKSFKLFIILINLFVLTGCIWLMGPSEKVDNMLSKYVKLDKSIISELNDYLDKQDLTTEEKTRYANIIKKEYSTIKYKIVEETIDDNFAQVMVDITVLDLYGAAKKAEDDLYSNPSKFYTDGVYDSHKFIDYKLSIMESYEKVKNYTIYITLSRHDDIWYIEELDNDTLLKIHGIYNYNE